MCLCIFCPFYSYYQHKKKNLFSFSLKFSSLIQRIDAERREAESKRRRQLEEEEQKKKAKDLEEQRRKELAKRQRDDRKCSQNSQILICLLIYPSLVLKVFF